MKRSVQYIPDKMYSYRKVFQSPVTESEESHEENLE
jgi:hypothetical protein